VCTNLQGQNVNSVNEVFADDLTAVFCMRVEAVCYILNILNSFGELSGLYINKESPYNGVGEGVV
jgi:hypothetical protein